MQRKLDPKEELAGREVAGVLAHQSASLLAGSILGVLGLYFWFGAPMVEAHKEVAAMRLAASFDEKALAGRFFLKVPGGLLIAQVNMAFQLYASLATLWTPALRQGLMVGHHAVAFVILAAHAYPNLLASTWLGCAEVAGEPPWGQYDLVFFFGLTEVSTIPLAIHDALKRLPTRVFSSPGLKATDQVAKGLFAVLFLAFRCLAFPVVIWGYWGCLLVQLEFGMAACPTLIVIILFGSFFMAGLQMFWGYKTCAILISLLTGGGQKDKTS